MCVEGMCVCVEGVCVWRVCVCGGCASVCVCVCVCGRGVMREIAMFGMKGVYQLCKKVSVPVIVTSTVKTRRKSSTLVVHVTVTF